ncbi:MAG TPA: transcriptional regulator GcvA [Stellaceae bacterium]|jgi:DNA-binding transcriptional LysR family regulator|nr:transcriptional regulator GcvA [Stellaceae bacterium]
MQGSLPLNGLRAFEAAARHLSFTRAADELHVTQAAVSHQVKTLEQRLGVKLFRRLPKSLRLTDEGQALLPELRDAFERMARALNRVTSAQGAAALSVSTLMTFALTWLVGRLPRFQARHPDIEVRLNTTGRMVDFAREDVDVAVRYGDGNWPGLTVEKMFEDELTPLCGRAYKDRLRMPKDLRDVPLMDASPPEPASVGEWGTWLRAAGINHLPMTRGAVFDSTKIAAQAAVDGMGVAIGSPYLFAEDIAAGRLFQPFPLTVRNGKAYWLVCAEGTATRPKIKAFRDWVFSELA